MCPYTSQHNGITEQENRTTIDMTMRMLKAKYMRSSFWVEAMCCYAYVVQQGANVTRTEAWGGYKPNVKHLKVFRSIAYAHVPTEKGQILMIEKCRH